VLEPGVVGPRVNEIRKPQLLDVPEPLESRGVQQGECKILDFDVPMDRVLDDLQNQFTKESSYTSHKSIE